MLRHRMVMMNSGPPRRPVQITQAQIQKHLDAHEEFQREAKLEDIGRFIILPDSDLVEATALHDLYRAPNDERIVQAGMVPLKLLQILRKERRNWHNLHHRQFEAIIAELVVRSGDWSTVVLTAATGDGGKDVVATGKAFGENITIYYECKRHPENDTVEFEALRAFQSVVTDGAHKGILVTTGRFSSGEEQYIAQHHRIEGRPFLALLEWMNDVPDWK